MTDRQTHIIVGYNGTSQAGLAVTWAATAAQREGRPLVVITAADHGLTAGPGSWGPQLTEEALIEMAADGAARASRVAPAAEITARTAHSFYADAGAALIEASRGAALMVVGNRGHGELVGAAVGSVAFELSAYAHSPVVVVRGAIRPPAWDRPVVVGVDGSEYSGRAILFAADTAAVHGAPLVVVAAFRSARAQVRTGAALLTLAGATAPAADGGATFDDIVRESGSRAVASASSIVLRRHPGLTLVEQVVEGGAVEVLCDAAVDAGMLVVGSRGRGALAPLALGSVSHGVIHAASCPVAIIR